MSEKDERMKKKINEEKKKAGQPVELSEEDKLVMGVANKVIDQITKKICRRCTNLLVSIDEKKNGYCDKCWELVVEQRTHERIERHLLLKNRLLNTQREIDFKIKQLDKKEITETMVITKGEDGKPLIYEGFKDNLKPDFMLHNEIAHLKMQVDMYNKQLDSMKKAGEQDAKTSNIDGGDKGTA